MENLIMKTNKIATAAVTLLASATMLTACGGNNVKPANYTTKTSEVVKTNSKAVKAIKEKVDKISAEKDVNKKLDMFKGMVADSEKAAKDKKTTSDVTKAYDEGKAKICKEFKDANNKSIEDISVISYKFRPLLTERDMFKPNESNFFQQHSYRYDRRIYPIRNDSSDRTRNNYVLFERYRKKYFNFIRNWDVLSDRSNEYIVISFNNLIIGNSKGILSFNNVYNIDQIQQISEYKVIPSDK